MNDQKERPMGTGKVCYSSLAGFMMLSMVACQSASGPASVANAATTNGASVEMTIEVLQRGPRCGKNEAGVEVIQDSQAWTTWWQRRSSLNYSGLGNAPEIDFETSTVVAVSMGTKPTGGHSVDILDEAAVRDGGSLTIPVLWREPPENALVPQIVTRPCIVVSVPAIGLHEITIVDQHQQGLRTWRSLTESD